MSEPMPIHRLAALSAFCVGVPLLVAWAKVRYWNWLANRESR
jgi:hypothetical protein